MTLSTPPLALCGLAPNVNLIIVARAFQGIGGALLVPGSLAIISASFDSKQRGRAIGTWSGVTAITSAAGPVLGGFLVQYASWHWVFFINVPLTTAVMGAVDTQYVGTASGVNNAVARTAGLIAIAVFGIIVLALFSNGLADQLPLLHISAKIQHAIILQENKLVGIDIPAGLSASTHVAIQQAMSASFITSFRVIMLIAATLAVCSSLSSLLLIEGKKQPVGKKTS